MTAIADEADVNVSDEASQNGFVSEGAPLDSEAPPADDEANEPPAQQPTATEPAATEPVSAVGTVKRGGAIRVSFTNSKFKMHPDVARLNIPTQTSAEYDELKENIIKTGRVRDPIKMAREPITKEEFVVDGWHRIHIADELGLPFDRQWVDYEDAVDVAIAASTRRNLTPAQRAALAQQLLEVEKVLAQNRQRAAARVTNLVNSVKKPEIIEVDYERLTAKGDIGSTYSGDSVVTTSKASNSNVRGYFDYDDKTYVAVDGVIGGRLICYRLTTIKAFRDSGGTLTNYVSRAEEWKDGKNDLGYDGILVNVKIGEDKTARVLQGPPIVFMASEESSAKAKAEQKKDGKGKKGEKTSGRASAAVAAKVGVSSRTLDMMEYVKKNDPAAYKRILNEETQPSNGLPETANSAYTRIKARQKSEEEAQATAAANGVPQAQAKSKYPDPDDLTLDEFVKGHPLYEQLKEQELFLDAVRRWPAMRLSLRGLKAAATKFKFFESRSKDQFSTVVMNAALIPHPYEWTLDDSKPGGFSIKPAPKPKAEPKPETEVKPEEQPAA